MLQPRKTQRPEQSPGFLNKEQVEQSPAIEKKELEVAPEKFSEEKKETFPKVETESISKTTVQTSSLPQDPVSTEIRQIMSKDLQDIYANMDPATQKTFKETGQKAAIQIKEMMMSGKVQAKKIFKLIFDWLKIIPGVNKFFIKQEAKIKTDRIINLDKK